jgi:hypothetical protein
MPATDEDLVRDLLHRCTEHVHPAAAVAAEVAARQRRRDRRRLAVSLATAGTAIGAAAGLVAVVPGNSSRAPNRPSSAGATPRPVKLTADQRALYHLSSVAAGQPAGQGRYAVLSTDGGGVKDTSVIDSRTGNMWSYQQGSDGNPSGKGFSRHYSPTSARFTAMPTGRAALRAALITQWHREQRRTSRSARKAFADAAQRARRYNLRAAAQHARGHKAPTLVPRLPRPITVSGNDIVFQQASSMLWNPLVSPALRSALYKVLAAVPGVRVNRSARDSTGRPAVEISRTDNSGLPGGKSDGITYATYESPATGAVLESTVTYPPGFGPVSAQDPQNNHTEVDATVYLGITWASSVPADPYGG